MALRTDQIAVPSERTFRMLHSVYGIVGEKTVYLAIGEAKRFAADFYKDMPGGGRFESIEGIALHSGTGGGITINSADNDYNGSRITFVPVAVTKGEYEVKIDATYETDGGSTVGIVRFVVV